jgi:diguanylate cyclase (GGDEF)-like protein/PAS domain S-box-containing protein
MGINKASVRRAPADPATGRVRQGAAAGAEALGSVATPSRVFSTAAGLVALLLVATVAGHLFMSWQGLRQQAQLTAETLASAVDLRGLSNDHWTQALQGLVRLPSGSSEVEWRGVRDAGGQLLAQQGPAPGSRWLVGRATLQGAEGQGASIEIARSPASLGWTLLVDVLLVGPLGTLGFFAGRRAWLRAQHRAQESRSQSERVQLLGMLFERSDDGVFICDAEGRVNACNPAAARLLRHPTEAIVGTVLSQWMRNQNAAEARAASASGFPLKPGEAAVSPRKGGPGFFAQLSIHATDVAGMSRYVVTLRDLTEQLKTQQKLQYLANYDSLTGLPNRVLFRDRLAQAMDRSRRGDRPMALFFLDLDRFKVVNDSLGHEAGDRLLQHVATVLSNCLRGGDSVMLTPKGEAPTLSRLGGDEFTVILEGIAGAEDAAIVAQRMLDALALPFKIGEEELQVSASIGISLFPTDDIDLDGIIRHTDMAMYRSKSLGRNMYSFFSDNLNAAVSARLSLEGSLRRAIERSEFCLHYQPKASLKTGEVTGVEALLRWHAPGRGMVPPDRFISVLEDTGLIVQAGAWVIRAACSQLAEWDTLGLPAISVAVNLSARQLRHPFLVSLVEDTLRETGLAPSRLELELTESLLMEDTDANRAVLTAFRKMGVRLAIDDFGTGHSSLTYLRRLDVDTLKIDRSFVTQIPDDPEDCAIATAVVALGKSLQMKVVAEGVETEAQAQYLRDLGCTDMQGWLLSKALPSELLVTWLRDHHRQYLLRTQPKRFQSAEDAEFPDIRIPDAPRGAQTVAALGLTRPEAPAAASSS